jgi:Myb DNA-binding like
VLQALATFGSDFTLIATLFPNKTRRQIKNKYSKESKVQQLVWCHCLQMLQVEVRLCACKCSWLSEQCVPPTSRPIPDGWTMP